MRRRLWRFLLVLVVALLIAALLSLAGVGVILVRAIPQRDGTATLAGLQARVTVRRDAAGIPHIYASSTHDLFAAQGYVHASERMWQMEIFRRSGVGRLSELFGKDALDRDRFIRTLGWRQAAERDLAAASPELRAALEAYAEGVNAWLATHGDLSFPFVVTGLLSGKGGLSGYRPEPWTPLDSATFAKVLAWRLGGNFDSELFRLLLAQRVDEGAVSELYAPYDPANPVIVPTGAPGSGGAGAARPANAADGRVFATPLDPAAVQRLLGLADLETLPGFAADSGSAMRIGPGGAGSNEWVIAPSHSATGHALLANDPHLELSMPSIWYINGLHCRPVTDACPYDVAGVSFPGDPIVVLGHNQRIAWGATNANPDVEDLFVERLDPADPSRYEYRGEMRPFETRTETIRVAGAPDETITVRSTVHGPVLDDVVKPLAPKDRGGGGLGRPGYVFALRWTATAEPDHVLEAFLGLDRARDFADFRAALSRFGTPSQNFIYADVEGHIGYQLPGRIPIRAGGHDGSVPAPGWDGSADWTGYVPYDALPRLYDPAPGFIVTANNAPVDDRYPYFLGREWDAGLRARRITDLISAKPRLSLADLAAIQTDTLLLRADPLIAAARGAQPATADGRTVRGLIAAWDGYARTDSTGAAAGEVFAYRLIRAVFDDELGAGTEPNALARLWAANPEARGVLLQLLRQAAAGDASSRWWDDVTTPDRREAPAEIVARALDQAGVDLRAALGDPSGWSWGRLHQMRYEEQTLGKSGIGPLEWILDRGPVPAPGSLDAVNNTAWLPSSAYPDPYDPKVKPADLWGVFKTVVTPSYRGLYDLQDWDASRIVSTTGQSGNPFDPHYDDLAGLWLKGATVPFPFSDGAVERATVQTLTLVP